MQLYELRKKQQDLHGLLKRQSMDSTDLQNQWNAHFSVPISSKDSEYFSQHYREMYGTRKSKGGKRRSSASVKRTYRRKTVERRRKTQHKKRGGSYTLTGAPLSYASAMGPGSSAAVYGNFPTDMTTDPNMIKSLDVYYNSALTRGCGIENSTRTVPVDMGSNKVGGGKKRKTLKGRKRQAGGVGAFYASAIAPIVNATERLGVQATPYPNQIQNWANSWSGNPSNVPTRSSPVHDLGYSYQSAPTSQLISPSAITSIGSSMSSLAQGAPWQ
jgi:hypothetical protein